MRWITARRRRPLFGYAAVLLALVAVGMLYAAVTGLRRQRVGVVT